MKKYALITGTDHGVGLELVKKLIERDYFVCACRLNNKEMLIDEVAKNNPDSVCVLDLDISSDLSVANMKNAVLDKVPCIDLLINNAGILGDMKKTIGDDLDFDEMLRVINVNSLGALRVTNALIDAVLKSEFKTIVNISSEAGSIYDCYREGWFGYCMSKAGNNMQSALVHNNIKEKGGRVIVIHPGHVATYMRGHLDTTASITPDVSADGILKTVIDSDWLVEDRPLFIDYKGEKLRF